MVEDLAKHLHGIDIYLLDQLMKGRISDSSKILDVGCGAGRNALALERFGCKKITAFDSNEMAVEKLKQLSSNISVSMSSIEDFKTQDKFDFIICSAVLHFAESHDHFHSMIHSFCNCMHSDTILFIRMTSNFAIRSSFQVDENGIANLGDGSQRYLLDNTRLEELKSKHHLQLIEPLKTVNVDNLRCMSTLILQKT